jgi:LuxR family transcriptional regulator, maltose regulon positive regulatory protein
MEGSTATRQSGQERLTTRTRLVHRRRLLRRISAVPPGSVVLICGPAGSGKTFLLRSCVEAKGLGEQVGWVSVDRGEQDAQRFWLSLTDALADAAGEEAVPRTAPTPDFRGEALVERLVSDLDSLEESVALVVDDLHELHSPDALAWLGLLVAHMPTQLRLVLATREEPQIGLHRLRLAGQLLEIQDPDLRFTRGETRELLETSGIELSDESLALLHERTEGWVAGLRLAALSLVENPDPDQFVAEFSGSERNVAGYLVAEVLERQPPDVRDLLLRTSILERICGPLADSLTDRAGSEGILQELEEANAFVSSLDVARSWFRYHHLFADFLRLELRRTDPASIRTLHLKAARWYDAHDYPVEAIRHFHSAGDSQQAARVLADNYLSLILDGRIAAVRELLGMFAPDAAGGDAELSLTLAATLIVEAKLDEVPTYVDLARRLADGVSEARRQRFHLHLAAISLALARRRGDLAAVQQTMRVMETALAVQPNAGRDLNEELRAVGLQELGIAELWSSRFDDGRRHLEQALELARSTGRPFLEVSCLGHLGVAGPWTGLSLTEGLELSEQAVRIAEEHGWTRDPIICTGLATGAIALLWLGRFGEAERSLVRTRRAMQPDGEPGTELLVHHARGLLRLAQGRVEDAVAAFRDAQRMETLLTSEHVFAVATRARLAQANARLGQVAEARAALEELSEADRDTSFMRVTRAEIHLAEAHPEQALDVLGPAIEGTAPAIHQPSAAVEAAVLEAAAREQLGDRRGAESSLEQALELAEPEGILLPFALVPLGDLLNRHPRHRSAHATLLSEILDVLGGASASPRSEAAPLLEELSEAELRVVRFLPGNLRAPEIAAELFVSPNTVRTHIRHIYAKLDVHSRKEAVERARELGLIGPSRASG